MSGVVIAGAGQAGLQTAASLRQGGYSGPIVMIGDEPVLPYQRPPLSKAYLKSPYPLERLLFRPPSFFAENDVTLLTERKVVAIDRARKAVRLDGDSTLEYDHLVLALGSRNRSLGLPGEGQRNVYQLRGLADAEALRDCLASAQRLVIVGGGFIGLEVAAVARAKGIAVTVLEAGSRLMARAVTPGVSSFFLRAHRQLGTEIMFGSKVKAIGGTGTATSVETDDGASFACDAVLVAAGIVANQEIAKDAGLEVSNGILVDERLMTADPSIFAIGDCAASPHPETGRPISHESVQNAIAQAKSVADQILGLPAHETSVPWFWSDQADYKLQMVGYPSDADRVVITETDNKLTTYCLRNGRLVGVETVNQPGAHMAGRKVLPAKPLIPIAELERPDFDLKSYAANMASANVT